MQREAGSDPAAAAAAANPQAVKEAFAKKNPEKRPRTEDVEQELLKHQSKQSSSSSSSNKRQRVEPPPSSSYSAAAAASSYAAVSASPSITASPSASASLLAPVGMASSPSAAAAASSSESLPDLLARVSRLEKENSDLRRSLETRTQQMLLLKAAAAEATNRAAAAETDRVKRDKELNQLRGELEGSRRLLSSKKDAVRSQMHEEALRNSHIQIPNQSLQGIGLTLSSTGTHKAGGVLDAAEEEDNSSPKL